MRLLTALKNKTTSVPQSSPTRARPGTTTCVFWLHEARACRQDPARLDLLPPRTAATVRFILAANPGSDR